MLKFSKTLIFILMISSVELKAGLDDGLISWTPVTPVIITPIIYVVVQSPQAYIVLLEQLLSIPQPESVRIELYRRLIEQHAQLGNLSALLRVLRELPEIITGDHLETWAQNLINAQNPLAASELLIEAMVRFQLAKNLSQAELLFFDYFSQAGNWDSLGVPHQIMETWGDRLSLMGSHFLAELFYIYAAAFLEHNTQPFSQNDLARLSLKIVLAREQISVIIRVSRFGRFCRGPNFDRGVR